MRLLITGGSGFIGTQLCVALSTRGHELWVLSRRPWRAAKKLPGSIVLIDSLDKVPDHTEFDGVVNFAGESIAGGRWSKRRKQKLIDSRVGITQTLYDLFSRLDKKPSVLINGSAVGFYGDGGNAELVETSPAVKRDFTYLLCDAWETEARRFSQLGARVCILRMGVVLSHHGGMLGKMLPLYKRGLGVLLGDGSQWLSWIHLEDLLELVLGCLEASAAEGIYNAVAPQPVSYRRFHGALAKACQRPALLRVPSLPLSLALGEMSVLMLGGQRVLPARLEREGFRFQYADIDSALCAEVG